MREKRKECVRERGSKIKSVAYFVTEEGSGRERGKEKRWTRERERKRRKRERKRMI